jgi:hypothetical protein
MKDGKKLIGQAINLRINEHSMLEAEAPAHDVSTMSFSLFPFLPEDS